MASRGVDREALVGVVIAGGFGIAWSFWAASGLSGGAATAVRVAAVVIGLGLVAGAMLRRRDAAPGGSARDGTPMFRSRGYLIWVAAEVVALVVGNVVLGATGHSAYVAPWTALVVGVHFLGFGRLFAQTYYWLGAAFVAAAVVGAVAGVVSGTWQVIVAWTGLFAAASLFAAGAWALLGPGAPDPSPTAR